MLLFVLISLNEQVEAQPFLSIRTVFFHEKLDLDHSYMGNLPLVVHFCLVFRLAPEI